MRPRTSSARTLILDRRCAGGKHRARSRGEALDLITANEYDTIILHTLTPGCDEYELIDYLAGAWPSFLRSVTIRTVTAGSLEYQWNHDAARFDPLPSRPRRPRGASDRSQPAQRLPAEARA